ncbi:hypothetical protein A3C21_01425 [Candidatus Kaiserbacteria bacterium RIFCSPHIGHO2_02_FULL_59_21]|uniref:Histidine biosynthesis bifunctional protein HisIE n=2 Tax=Candidatus Kaiseribacteriota TaxID=1752734 RepID=A0A0G1YW81_9BACT|nr:MAG: Phosphoribosyl-AMP cyclohydrolase/phosphoribosyl-ATP pyrophosphatase [Candidatus Kaiserbacteria bacterium GW2011_GWA2_58_9]OGG62483.1 MAG: hypothetical protein A2766_00745 [Candidatus Kaiserbacteria bacterium RIFCSPHIGHO2_01_FULL_58_22]OGG67531.1 MAG: hypothetical protein A3C21_01425 [Candidatus Kaiserbacteria bacterium RIFCSPHIGHO2_02_FULL_59_21]OGG80135.1 MAG: hypothetical protein A2952_03555 [Candidatus Kaiserbacteria bacterium RIFCSPLOWO2_01_FULL_59_34]OGG86926.1 MAG: hypothetical p
MTKKLNIDWKKGGGFVPAIVQDAETRAVLMLGYMNKAALTKTLKTKKVWFWSRSKKRLWMKGEFSRNILQFTGYEIDCDGDALLVKARPAGPTCHTGDYSCFGEKKARDVFAELAAVIAERKKKMPVGSYTTSLFKAGVGKITAKVKEEALEVVKAAKKETKKRLTEETVDLVYHLLVLLAEKNVSFSEIGKEIRKRRA